MNTEIGKWRRRKKRKKPQKISICRSFVARVRHHARSLFTERERERREHASSATCSENGGRANGRPPYCHTLGPPPPPPAIIIIKFRAHNHSNGHQRPGGSGGRRARVTRSPTAQRAHRRHTRVHGLTTPARTRRRMKRRKERRE